MTRSFWLEHAILDGRVTAGVRLVEDDGLIVGLQAGEDPRAEDTALSGLAVPGFANAHSHAFHRVLRGRTGDDGGDFWTWRRLMYRAVERLDVDAYRRVATAAYAEMVLAGYTAVGEFHYVHHRADGRPYEQANAMGEALIAAAADAGIRLTLLDTMYVRGGLDDEGRPLALEPAQRRFTDGGVDAWFARHDRLRSGPRVRIGAAVHSVRAVDVTALGRHADRLTGMPLHAHVSEQPRENAQSAAAYGLTPVGVFEAAGLLGPDFTAVHATHLTSGDIRSLAVAGAVACFCPTTERDLADGIGPARALAEAGVALAIGSDQHVVVDPFEELRALEGHERLASGRRGRFSATELLRAGTADGYRSLGWDGGRLERGAVCDLVILDPRSPRTAGTPLDRLWTTATAADVRDVVVGGAVVVAGGRHRRGDVGELLASAVAEILD